MYIFHNLANQASGWGIKNYFQFFFIKAIKSIVLKYSSNGFLRTES